MKITGALIILFLVSGFAFSQTDYSGNYGYSYKTKTAKTSTYKPSKDDTGPSAGLTLLFIDKTHYKFWLDVNKGWPNYHVGYINGILVLDKNTGVYKERKEFNDSICGLYFTFSSRSVDIEQQGTDIDCGFGAYVYADGTYKKYNSRKVSADNFRLQYIDVAVYKITVEKAFVFEDSSGLKKKDQYFILNDEVLSTNNAGSFIYIEHLTKSGKFIYGWIRKSETDYIEQ